MEEEIVVDDLDENSTADTQQADDSTTPVMPLLYIQQNKVRSTQSSNVNQTLVSPSTQFAAIINPVKNQVIIESMVYKIYNGTYLSLTLAFYFVTYMSKLRTFLHRLQLYQYLQPVSYISTLI